MARGEKAVTPERPVRVPRGASEFYLALLDWPRHAEGRVGIRVRSVAMGVVNVQGVA